MVATESHNILRTIARGVCFAQSRAVWGPLATPARVSRNPRSTIGQQSRHCMQAGTAQDGVHRGTMTKEPDALDAYIDAAAAALSIPLEPEWKSEIRANLEVTF